MPEIKKPPSGEDGFLMVGLAGLPALRSGYASFPPAPPQADLINVLNKHTAFEQARFARHFLTHHA